MLLRAVVVFGVSGRGFVKKVAGIGGMLGLIYLGPFWPAAMNLLNDGSLVLRAFSSSTKRVAH